MVDIHPTAVIDPGAEIGADVQIGPFCVIEANTHIGDRTRLESHVCIKSGTSLGEDNHVFDHAVLGGEPQHLSAPAEQGQLEIGSGNKFREYVTVHRALDSVPRRSRRRTGREAPHFDRHAVFAVHTD